MTGHAVLRLPMRPLGRTGRATFVLLLLAAPGFFQTSSAQPTSADPASAQPSIPKPLNGSLAPDSAVIGGAREKGAPVMTVRPAKAVRAAHHRGRSDARRRRDLDPYVEPLERPALAGVELVAPIPVPRQPPHFTVPVPAYPLENAVTYYTTPLPPVVCHRVPRDPYAPDPHLIRETTVLCEADNP